MKLRTLAIAAMFAVPAMSQTKSPAPFKNGDRIVFAGNSITEAGFYPLYVWLYYQLHFPNDRIVVMNGGIGGDVAGQILDRFEGDLLRQKPSVIVLTFGMNDSRYFEYFNAPAEQVRKDAVQTSLNSFLGIEAKLKALPDVQKIIMTSSPFDETRAGSNNKFTGKHQTMAEIAAFQEAGAQRNGWGFVDLLKPMTEIDQREQKLDSNFTLTGPDRIHPGNAGHMVMAWLFLKAQGMAGKPVADVAINAGNGKLLKAVNSNITQISQNNGGIRFNYLAKSLPFPIDSNARVWENPQKQYEALRVIPFTEEMNKEVFTITGLKSNKEYELKLDGKLIGSWSGAEFAKGINLALQSNTPQYQQARKVEELNYIYRDLEQKLRAYYWLQFNYFSKKNMMYQDDQAAMDSVITTSQKDWFVGSKKDNYQEARKKAMRDKWEKEMADIIDRIYTINKPVSHSVEITPKS